MWVINFLLFYSKIAACGEFEKVLSAPVSYLSHRNGGGIMLTYVLKFFVS